MNPSSTWLYVCFFLIGIVGWHIPLHANHLVGGDLTYRYGGRTLDGLNEYEITLNLYRDCVPTDRYPVSNTPFDRRVDIYIFNAQTMAIHEIVSISLTDSVILQLTSSDSCVTVPEGLCYTTTSYRKVVSLPDNPQGYHIVWTRCCRNQTILNIFNPGFTGMAFHAFIPTPTMCNSSPYFFKELPTFICIGNMFEFDHSAIDIDGDSLAYKVSDPYVAGSVGDPVPRPAPPPYRIVNWQNGFGVQNVMNGSPNLTIDPRTGKITVGPTQQGQYVFSVSVFEYRDGNLLSEIKRDIQINVIECSREFPAPDLVCSTIDNKDEVGLIWSPIDEIYFPGFESYEIYRNDGSGWSQIATITDPLQDSYQDNTAFNADARPYCYRLVTVKRCPARRSSQPGNELCAGAYVAGEFCGVSYDRMGKGVELSWSTLPGRTPNVVDVYRRAEGSTDRVLIGSVTDVEAGVFRDTTVRPSDRFCYQLEMENPCGELWVSDWQCPVFLEVEGLASAVRLEWEDYQGWTLDQADYELMIYSPGFPDTQWVSLATAIRLYEDRQLIDDQATYCYRLRVQAPSGTCRTYSWSDERCHTFPARVFFPNAFTPNRDGINEVFRAYGAFLVGFELAVFDRWGKQVFAAEAQQEGWDGTISGQAAPEGVYVYRCSWINPDGERQARSGSVTLLR